MKENENQEIIRNLVESGQKLYNTGCYSDAITMFKKALEQDDKDHKVCIKIADAYYKLSESDTSRSNNYRKNKEKSVQYYLKAIDLVKGTELENVYTKRLEKLGNLAKEELKKSSLSIMQDKGDIESQKDIKIFDKNTIPIQKIEQWRSEIISSEREEKRKALLLQLEEGKILPPTYESLKLFIEAKSDKGEKKEKEKISVDYVVNYAKDIQAGKIKTPEINDICSLNLVNKLSLNIMCKKGSDKDRESLLLEKVFLTPKNGTPLCDKNNLPFIKEYIKTHHPALQAFLNTTPEKIVTDDFSVIKCRGSAFLNRDKEFFTLGENGLNLVTEARKEVANALSESKGTLSDNVKATLAKYDIKALKYYKKQIEMVPEMKKEQFSEKGTTIVKEEKYDIKINKKESYSKEECIQKTNKMIEKSNNYYKSFNLKKTKLKIMGGSSFALSTFVKEEKKKSSSSLSLKKSSGISPSEIIPEVDLLNQIQENPNTNTTLPINKPPLPPKPKHLKIVQKDVKSVNPTPPQKTWVERTEDNNTNKTLPVKKTQPTHEGQLNQPNPNDLSHSEKEKQKEVNRVSGWNQDFN